MALINKYPYSDFENLNLDWLIRIVKEYVEKTDKVEIDMAELKAYVDNYFENLDVQDEIDNKLQEMYDNGDLAVLIAQFLSTESLLVFKTEADMIAAVNLADGVTVLCDGQTTYNDGKSALFYIRTVLNTDVIDGVDKIALTNYPTLLAERLIQDYSAITTPIYDYINNTYEPRHVAPLQLYVSATTGSDSNPGTSSGAPLETINAALAYINKGYSSLDVDILDNGSTYHVTQNYFTGLTLHLSTSLSANRATVIFDNGCRLYDCHVNFARLDISCGDSSVPYQDSNYCTYNACTFPGGYTSNGGILNMADCTAPQLQLTRTNFSITNLTISGTTSSAGTSNGLVLIQSGSSGYIQGITISNVSSSGIYAVLNVRYGSFLYIGGTPSVTIADALKTNFQYSFAANFGSIVTLAATQKTLWTTDWNIRKLVPSLVLSSAQEL